jgi:hypothetical protein
MYGLESNASPSALRDEMRNAAPGYSFVSHSSNGLADGYGKLLLHACAQHGSLSPLAGHGRWSWIAVKQYLLRTKQLEEMLMGGLYTSCGQAPRLRELASLEIENSPTSMRGIYIWNGSVIYIIRHHKAKRTTNHEFNVVRFLPSRLGIVLIQYLAYIRGVARVLRHEVDAHAGLHGPVQGTRLLFHQHGKPWLAERMTAILRAAGRKVWGQNITSQMYRQVTIGITEKHVREVFAPFNRYDDHSTTADKNAAFAWQSGHRPAQRATTYGLDGAYPHQLQPSLLRVYEWASTRWHEFLHQASKTSKRPADHPSESSQSTKQNLNSAPLALPVISDSKLPTVKTSILARTPASWLEWERRSGATSS